MSSKYELVNPRVMTKDNKKKYNAISAKSVKSAAKQFFTDFSKLVKNKGEYKFLFTIKDKKTKEIHHFNGQKIKSGGSFSHKVSAFTLKKNENTYKNDVYNVKKLIGGKKGSKKKKRGSKKKNGKNGNGGDWRQYKNFSYSPFLYPAFYPNQPFFYYDAFLYNNLHYIEYMFYDHAIAYPNLIYPVGTSSVVDWWSLMF
jgi:hypothetical protein